MKESTCPCMQTHEFVRMHAKKEEKCSFLCVWREALDMTRSDETPPCEPRAGLACHRGREGDENNNNRNTRNKGDGDGLHTKKDDALAMTTAMMMRVRVVIMMVVTIMMLLTVQMIILRIISSFTKPVTPMPTRRHQQQKDHRHISHSICSSSNVKSLLESERKTDVMQDTLLYCCCDNYN